MDVTPASAGAVIGVMIIPARAGFRVARGVVANLPDVESRDPYCSHMARYRVEQVVGHEMRGSGIPDEFSKGPRHIRLGDRAPTPRAREYPFGIEAKLFDLIDNREHGRRKRHSIGPLGLRQLGRDVPPVLSPVEIGPTHP